MQCHKIIVKLICGLRKTSLLTHIKQSVLYLICGSRRLHGWSEIKLGWQKLCPGLAGVDCQRWAKREERGDAPARGT